MNNPTLETKMKFHLGRVTQTCAVVALMSTAGAFASTEVVAGKTAAAASSNTATPAKPLTLSSAKTVRELIEMDDQIALSKERKALREEQNKARESEPISNKEDPAAAQKRANDKANSSKEMALAAATIKITGIMGVEGQRVVQAEVGGRNGTLLEGSANQLNGWKLSSVTGRCASFTRVSAIGAGPETAEKRAKRGTAKSTNTSADQLVCYITPPPPVIAGPSYGGMPPGAGMPGGMPPRPIPIPMPVSIR